jgi:hypothetical protein
VVEHRRAVETAFLGTLYVLFLIEIGTRRVHVTVSTTNPNSSFVTQQARNLVMSLADEGPADRLPQALPPSGNARVPWGPPRERCAVERLAAHLKPDVRRWALCPDPDGTSEDHANYVGELADAANLRQYSFDGVDLVNGERFTGGDVDMEVAPLKRRDTLFSRDGGDGPSRIDHSRSS